jgi:GntR family transcriptional regulator
MSVGGCSNVAYSTDYRERRGDAARRLRDLLRLSIVHSAADGSLLVESDLQAAYGVSRNTVRDALDLLRGEGLIERVPGVGTFAVARKARHRFDRLQGLSEGIDHGTTRVAHELLTWRALSAPATVAAELGLPTGAPAVLIERRSHIDGEPLAIGTHWLPAWAGSPLQSADLGREFYSLYEHCLGLPVEGCRLVVEAVQADAGTAELLRIPEGAALLRFERHVLLTDGRTIEFGFVRCRGDRLSLESSLVRTPSHRDGA